MALNFVSVILDLTDGEGNPVISGSATFTPSALLTDVPDGVIITQAPIQIPFNFGGSPSVRLLATDNPSPAPSGWTWDASFSVNGGITPYAFFVPAGPASFTATSATPAVFTWTPTAAFTAAGLTVLPNGTGVQLSGGSLPTGFTAATTYYVVGSSGSTFSLSATPGGSAIASTSTGSGNVTVTQYNLSSLSPVGTVGVSSPFMLVPSGTATEGLVPVATGSGGASEWGPGGGVTVLVPEPTGATATDTPAVTTAISNLVSALSSGPATLLFQDGTYQVDSNSAVIRSVSNFAVRSAGRTVLAQAPNRSAKPNNTTGDILIIADCTDFRVEGITVDGLRDTLSPITPLTATAASGQPSVTVASGQGSRYIAGQKLYVFGGLGTSEQNQSEGLGVGSGTPLTVSSITPGGGSGGGDLITFTTNLANSYTHVSGSTLSDGYGPYACTGAYLTSYQCGKNNSVAGRTLSGEDQQNGLHLLNCQRFTVSRVTARNVWESPVKLGCGFDAAPLSDACSQGTITDCITYHGYDQGISVWLSSSITVKGCVANATGWAGVSLSLSDLCTVTGNQILNCVYRAAGDVASGSGIAIEAGIGNQVTGNIITSPYNAGVLFNMAPPVWAVGAGNAPTASAYLTAGTAAGTSVQVSSTAVLTAGARLSILDGAQTEAVTVQTVVDGTHVTFAETLKFSHPSGVFISGRIPEENVIAGNTVRGTQAGSGINAYFSVRSVIKHNAVSNWASGAFGLILASTAAAATGLLPSGVYIGGDGSSAEGNTFISGGGNSAVEVNYVSGIKLTGNTATGYFPSFSGGAFAIFGLTDSLIAGNVLLDIPDNAGMQIANGGPGTAVKTARVTITGNTVERTSGLEGILVTDADSLTITGNTVRSCATAGIDLQGVTNSVISGNICNSNQGAGIRLENDGGSVGCSNNRVTGNTCRDDGSGLNIDTGSPWTQQYGIQETGNSNSNLFTGNECDSNGTAQLAVTGTSSVQYANTLSGTLSLPPSAVFGDGSDGAVTLDGAVSPSWAAKSGSGYGLTRDVDATSLTINSGVTLYTNGWHVFCAGVLTNNGSIIANGGNASGTNGSTAGGGANTLVLGNGGGSASPGGVNGGTGAGSGPGQPAGSSGVGSGGSGGTGSGGAGGGQTFASVALTSMYRFPATVLTWLISRFGNAQVVSTVAGSSGGGDGTNKGGGGGGSAGIIPVFAHAIANNGTISANGGNGGTATTGNCGGGGGGGGGLVLLYTLAAVTGSGSVTVAGGTGGSGVGTGTAGGAGGSGNYLNVIVQ